jgi:hypothetical protein
MRARGGQGEYTIDALPADPLRVPLFFLPLTLDRLWK